MPFCALRHARHGVAAVTEHHHRFDVVLLGHILLVVERRVEPPGRRDARRVHGLHRLAVGSLDGVETVDEPLIVDAPDPRPVPPRAFDQAVVERQRHDIEAEVGRALHVGVAAEDVGAGAGRADVAGGEQRDAERADVGGADGVLGRAHAPDQRRWLLCGERLGDALHLSGRHAGDALDFGWIPLLDLLADVVHAVDALLDELLVFPAVLEDVPQQPVDHRNVGAGADADILGGVRRGPRHARIDHDHLGAVHLLAFKDVLQRHRVSLGGVGAHEDDRLGVADVRVAVGHRAVAPGVGYAGDGGGVADAGLVVGVVGAPERRELAVEIGAFVGELGGAEPVHRVGAGLAADLRELVADLVDRDVPGDAAPFAVHELDRVPQAAVAVHQLAGRGALGAVRAAADRGVPTGLLTDPDAVLHFTDHGAADRAVRADVLADRHRHAGLRPGCGSVRLAHAGERQGADRGEAADREAGAAQEAAAIEGAAGLTGQRGGERAAACLTFCSLDKHGRLLSSGTGSRDRTPSRDRFPCSGLSAFHRSSRYRPWRRSRAGRRQSPQRPHPRQVREGTHGVPLPCVLLSLSFPPNLPIGVRCPLTRAVKTPPSRCR